jgi:septum formation protein
MCAAPPAVDWRSLSLWLGQAPLVLASASPTRRLLLEQAGLPVDAVAADIDERAQEAALGGAAGDAVAAALARAKAVSVSRVKPGRLVLGADQTLTLDGRALHKPAGLAGAREQIAALQGRTHQLVSAFAIARDGVVIGEGAKAAQMTMRALSPTMIDAYLAAAGDGALGTVGAYRLEGFGLHLMARVEGDHFTVLGLPMIEVLAALRALGAVRA